MFGFYGEVGLKGKVGGFIQLGAGWRPKLARDPPHAKDSRKRVWRIYKRKKHLKRSGQKDIKGCYRWFHVTT